MLIEGENARAYQPFFDYLTGALVKQFPQAIRLVTPFNDPIAHSIEEYQTFLRALGYKPVAKAAFGKPLKGR